MNHKNESKNHIQRFKGIPNKIEDKERSLWRKFIAKVFPWITRKWDLGNAFLEAKVIKEINEGEKLAAETNLINIQAQKEMNEIADIANQEDEISAQSIEILEDVNENEIEQDLNDLREKIRVLYLKYGFKINISFEDSDGQSLDFLGIHFQTLRRALESRDPDRINIGKEEGQ